MHSGAASAASTSSSTSSRSSSSLVRELDQAFASLSIIQAHISRVSAALTRRSRSSSRVPLAVAVPVSLSSSPVSSVAPPPLPPSGSIAQGDRVRYPRSWQQPIGIAESFRSDFITVRTPNGDGVKRYEKNLILLDRADTF